MALEYSTIAGYCLPAVEAVGDSLYVALDAAGNRPVRALQRLRAVPFGAEQARMLGVDAGAPGLLIEELFKRVRIGVAADTARVQVPWESSSLTTDFCFKPNAQGHCG